MNKLIDTISNLLELIVFCGLGAYGLVASLLAVAFAFIGLIAALLWPLIFFYDVTISVG